MPPPLLVEQMDFEISITVEYVRLVPVWRKVKFESNVQVSNQTKVLTYLLHNGNIMSGGFKEPLAILR